MVESIKNDPRFSLSVTLPEQDLAGGKKLFGPGLEIISVSLSRKGLNPLAELRSIFSLYKALKKNRPSLLHNFTIKPVIYGSIAGRLSKTPVILNSITGMGYVFTATSFKARLIKSIVVLLYRFISSPKNVFYIFQNKVDLEYFMQSGITTRERCFYIPGSGVNISNFQPAPTNNAVPRIFFAGRLLKEKGIWELLDALKDLQNKNIKFEAWIAGDIDNGNPGSLTADELETIKKSPYVKYLGYRSDLASIFNEIDIACLPSYREGMPMFLLEALASGKPVVTTNAPGCSEVVFENINGYMVPVKNAKALAAALEKLLVQNDLRETMGRQSRKLAEEKFSSIAINNEIKNLYSSLTKAES